MFPAPPPLIPGPVPRAVGRALGRSSCGREARGAGPQPGPPPPAPAPGSGPDGRPLARSAGPPTAPARRPRQTKGPGPARSARTRDLGFRMSAASPLLPPPGPPPPAGPGRQPLDVRGARGVHSRAGSEGSGPPRLGSCRPCEPGSGAGRPGAPAPPGHRTRRLSRCLQPSPHPDKTHKIAHPTLMSILL